MRNTTSFQWADDEDLCPPAVYATGDRMSERCPDCGGDCAPECGLHPAGCVYGGFSGYTAYWLVANGCDRDHETTHPEGNHAGDPGGNG